MWEENLHTPDISILSYFTKQKENHSASWHCCSEARFYGSDLVQGKSKSTAKSSASGNNTSSGEKNENNRVCLSVPNSWRSLAAPGHRPSNRERTPGSVGFAFIPNSVPQAPPAPRPTARPGLHSSPALARRTHSAPRADHPPARSQLGSAGAAPAARRPLAGCHVTLRGNQELRGAADGRGRGRGRGVRGG